MNLQIFFEWHKLLHFILPVIIIFTLQKQFRLSRICMFIFMAGFLKEIYDTLVLTDPLWVAIIDMVLSAVGITLGLVVVSIKNLHLK